MLLLIECLLVVIAIVVAFVFPNAGERYFVRIEKAFVSVARKPRLAVLGVGVCALALRAALLPILPIPEPVIHDEFGYLLAADTFSHGRLTNPTHPTWVFFETFSVLQKPTYQTFGQPGQGMILALGKVLFGSPFWGVWLSVGVMCAAVTWMLQGWVAPPWALLGGFLAILRYGVFGYWANSYWGGAIGAIGGALVLGALPRIKQAERVHHAVIMATGLALLVSSRPFEGFVLSLPIAISLFIWMLAKRRPSLGVSIRKVVLPISLILAITFISLSYYCWRVTKDPLRLPYQVERASYAAAPLFVWQPVPPPHEYVHPVMERMYVGEELQSYKISLTPVGLLLKIWLLWTFFLGPVLTLPLIAAILLMPYGLSIKEISKETRFLFLVLLFVLMGHTVETFLTPHYASPSTALFMAFVVLATLIMRGAQWRGRRVGLFLARAIPAICVVMFVLRASAGPLRIPIGEFYTPAWYQQAPKGFGRGAVQARLQSLAGQHLVLVRYRPEHEPFEEWVYNDADIDRAKIVWAHDMGAARNQELINYFKDRQVWLLQPDISRDALARYELPTGASAERSEEVQP